MDSAIIQRIIIAAMFGLVLWLISYWSIRLGLHGRKKDGRRVYASFSYYGALPFVLLILGAISRLMLGDEADPMLFTSLFSVAVSLTVYYVLLALLMPWLRRRISAWSCAALWLLPNVRDYTDEELRLVLTHEAIHIARNDSYSKFALVSIAALCWFNPLVWLAMRKSAEDIELSCDESVTFGASSDERRRYADLILSSAGDGRGFTTCLSAKASSLRYRLKNVMQPAMKSSGALVIGIATFLLILICGQVALAYGGGTGEELIFNSEDPALYVVDENDCTDPEGLKAYIASLELSELTNGYDFDYGPDIRHKGVLFDAPNGQLYIGFFDNILEYLGPGGHRIVYYYLPEGTDWARLDSFFES